MANEFEAGICGENWWNNNNNQSRIPLETSAYSAVLLSDMGTFRWSAADMALLMDMKAPARSTSDDNDDDDQSAFVCDNSIAGFQKSNQDDSDWLLGFVPSSATSEWNNQMLFEGTERNESNYNSMVQEDIPSSSFLMESANTHIYPSSTSTVRSLFETQQQKQQPPSVLDSYQSSPKCGTKQQSAYHLHYSNNTPFWHAALAAAAVDNEIQTSFLSSHHSTFEEKSSCTTKLKTELRDSIVMKNSNEHAFKRPRIESPLPTFKVRKEKLGDRVTALQQLVSPFGKNDTASVLHEAIDYIKFLHDQVNVLSTPYMKNGAHTVQHQQISNKVNDSEGTKNDLRSKGLCLVPISSTYSVANETAADFWTPTFTGNFM